MKFIVSALLLVVQIRISISESITEHCYNAYRRDRPPEGSRGGANGVEAKLKEFPHLTLIGWSEGASDIFWGCGGSLVTPKFVLSAGHCAYRNKNGTLIPPDIARMGTIELDTVADREEFMQQFHIVGVIPHPKYRPSRRYFDIALMELDREVHVTEYVTPICLWNKPVEIFTELQASGFGETVFGGGMSPKLQKVTLTRTRYEECRQRYALKIDRKLKNGLIEDQHMCASDKTGFDMDTCQGDSGDPLEFKMITKVRDQWIKVPVLVGVTSFGETGCGNSAPAVYTRVSSFIPWIESETKQNLNLETCSKRFPDMREYTFSPFLQPELPSNVRIISFFGICPGVIIHERFVLAANECASDSHGGHIRTPDGQEIGIEKIHKNNGLALVELKNKIKYTKRTALPDPYIYELGPACLEADQPDPYRSVEAKFQNVSVQIKNYQLYNVSDCLEFLGETRHLDGSKYECLSGVWLAPNECQVEATFSFYINYIGVDFYSFPSLKSFVVNEDNCGSILMKKIMKADIDWISSVIFV